MSCLICGRTIRLFGELVGMEFNGLARLPENLEVGQLLNIAGGRFLLFFYFPEFLFEVAASFTAIILISLLNTQVLCNVIPVQLKIIKYHGFAEGV